MGKHNPSPDIAGYIEEDRPIVYSENPHLSQKFLDKWVFPFYLEITSPGDEGWDDRVKEIKPEMTTGICMLLLGSPSWQAFNVGTYFSAVKGYSHFIDHIGARLLKRESHWHLYIPTLVLAFFNNANCVQYLHRFLDLCFEGTLLPEYSDGVDSAMSAVLYLDKENKTDYFDGYLKKWKILIRERVRLDLEKDKKSIKDLEELVGIEKTWQLINKINGARQDPGRFTPDYHEREIAILRELNQYEG